MSLNMKRLLYVAVITAGFMAAMAYLPETIAYSIKVPGKIIHAREWVIQRSADGGVTATFQDHRTGYIRDYTAVRMERGDASKFELSSGILQLDHIAAGDTVGTFRSNALQQQLSGLKRELALAQASLDISAAGEKAEIVREAEIRLALAEEKLKNQERILMRQDSLYRKNLISGEKYENTKSLKEVNEIELSISRAHLAVVQSGAKPEEMDFLKSQIEAISAEVSVLEERIADLTLVSPIAGQVLRHFSGDTLLVVAESEGLILMPVQTRYFDRIGAMQSVTFELPHGEKAEGTIIRSEAYAQILNNKQVLVVYGELSQTAPRLPYGLIVPCAIALESLRPLEFVWQKMKSILI